MLPVKMCIRDRLTLESRKKIEDALIALDYKENKVARSLANGKSEMIGIIIPDLFLHYYSQMLNCLINTYSKYNYKFLVFVENHDTNKESKYTKEMNYIKELMAYQIEGLIILSNTIDSKTLSELSIPIVSIEREDKYISSVNSDNYAGACLLYTSTLYFFHYHYKLILLFQRNDFYIYTLSYLLNHHITAYTLSLIHI